MVPHPPNPLIEFTFSEAAPSERIGAIQLFRRVYQQDIGHIPEDNLDELAHHLIAKTPQGDIVASLRLLGPELRPFDIEPFCDLSAHLSDDSVPALIGRLSLSHHLRALRQSIPLQLGMLKLAITFARRHSLTDLFLYAMPHLISVYRTGFFKPIPCTFHYAPLNLDMQVMQLNIRELETRRRLTSSSPRLNFLFNSQRQNFRV
jgi:predicted GNAT family N-acyltransferase